MLSRPRNPVRPAAQGMSIPQASRRDLYHNCRIKAYPDGSVDLCAANRQIFREPGWEGKPDPASRIPSREAELEFMRLGSDPETQPDILTPEEESLLADPVRNPAEALDRAKRRAKSAVRDLGLSNEWAWFVTLTLDKQQVDRYDVTAVTRKLNQWLDNHVRRDGLAYVLVPERHRDGAIHFHGFFNGALRAADSGTVSLPGEKRPRRPRSAAERAAWLSRGGHAVYNLPQWTLGFTTAIALYGERRAAVSYVCKYLTKAQEKIGGRWYYSGGTLRKPEVSYADVNLEDLSGVQGARPFTVPQLPGVELLTLTVQDACEVNRQGPKMSLTENGTSPAGLQFSDCPPARADGGGAMPAEASGRKNDRQKIEGRIVQNDNRIPVEPTD